MCVCVHEGGLGSQGPGIWMELGAGRGGGQDGGVAGGPHSRKCELLSLAPHVLSRIYKHRGRRDVNNQWAAARGRVGAGGPGWGPGLGEGAQDTAPQWPAHLHPLRLEGECDDSRVPQHLPSEGVRQAAGSPGPTADPQVFSAQTALSLAA